MGIQVSVVNFPRNPRFWSRMAFKMAHMTKEMEDRKYLLTHHAVVIKDEGSLGVRSCEEMKDLIFHQFGIRKHEFFMHRSYPSPFITIFSERHARDIVFVVGRAIDGAIELRFCS
jgi:hypothetical protein